ncbi:methylmalonyl-CoA mutase family protein [Winogradskyella sp. 3972H.M.0a.05]|uniref:methylmalonyl-CoA mutase subunit beta n=1 Tax=Winogradskyella sp. 3972H.M.0a.05 TaxID=2950277 RepID=UPI0033980C7C
MTKPLFNEFPEVSSKQWKQKIQVDLKGADYNDTLIWNTNEGIDVKPFYHSDEFDEFNTIPKTKTTWKIGETIIVDTAVEANSKAIDSLQRGTEALTFVITQSDIDIQQLLKGIDLDAIPVHLETTFLSDKFVTSSMDTEPSRSAIEKSHLYFNTDIIHNLAKSGNWYSNLKKDHLSFEAIVKSTNQITVDATLYQNAGATIIQQLAYALAHANEYLNHFETRLDEKSKSTLTYVFKVSVGTNYFFEIAKLRALRLLWQSLASEYNINSSCKIIAQPSKRNKTIYDYNTNMLRTTTECMSAILGGADEVYNLPYDAIYHNPNEFGDRISRNQLLVLKRESYFDKVENASDGAYYIESLTEQLANKALELFKDIESNGGFLSQLKEGTIQRKIKESAAKEQEQFNDGTLVLLGTNKHPNTNDKMKDNLEIDPFLQKTKRKTLIEPIIEKRLSETTEKERLKDE